MYEKLLTEAEKYIETLPVKEIPILEMWDVMMERSETEIFEMPDTIGDFECLLEADKRFIFIQKIIDNEIDDVDLGEEEGEYEVGEDFFEVEEMEKIGFNQHQIVGLKKFEKKKPAYDAEHARPVKHKSIPAAAAQRKSATKKTPPRPVKSTMKKKKK